MCDIFNRVKTCVKRWHRKKLMVSTSLPPRRQCLKKASNSAKHDKNDNHTTRGQPVYSPRFTDPKSGVTAVLQKISYPTKSSPADRTSVRETRGERKLSSVREQTKVVDISRTESTERRAWHQLGNDKPCF